MPATLDKPGEVDERQVPQQKGCVYRTEVGQSQSIGYEFGAYVGTSGTETKFGGIQTVCVEKATSHRQNVSTHVLQSNDCLSGLATLILDRLACGVVSIDRQRRIRFINETARRVLDREESPCTGADSERYRNALGILLDRTKCRITTGALFWVAVSHRCAITEVIEERSKSASEDENVIILLDLDSSAMPTLAALRRIFGLTSAEANLAIAMTQGISPDVIAANRSVSRTTIRSQLAAVFAKTQTRRQAELVVRLGRLAIVP